MQKKKKQQKPWQFKFSFGLTMFMLLPNMRNFIQSFLEIRKVKLVSVAIERVNERKEASGNRSLLEMKQVVEKAVRKDWPGVPIPVPVGAQSGRKPAASTVY